ncbi:putative CRISPR-associated endoribonuclease Cas2 [Crenothrix polyspora]|uniref:CRISPR-associated endoribonuclease Cas2 n=1 Tax=Crenothrix polyspora TaxID=360316 RepID=A0A1R4H1G9_9GAMM|nr:CRISPR-associated endonuclease Cas2 [Crenothrix polyspora]SJM89900.1 putative CRISPR-associated endoribonuclease Cas2 [Crenothrix polyspora]
MADKRKFLICYDIVDSKRLRRAHRLLSDIAMSVQYSVFEAELSNAELQQLQEKLMPCIDSEADKLTIYRLFKTNAKIDLAVHDDDELLYI